MPCPYNIIFGRETALPCPLCNFGIFTISLQYLCNFCSVFDHTSKKPELDLKHTSP